VNNPLDKLNLRPFEKRLVVGVGVVLFNVLNAVFVWPHFKDWGDTRDRLEGERGLLEKYHTAIAQKGEFARKVKIATKSEIVSPDQAVVVHGLAQQLHDDIHHATPEGRAVPCQFGHVAKGRLDQDLDGRAGEPLAKGQQPGRVGRFAGGQHHGTDALRPVGH